MYTFGLAADALLDKMDQAMRAHMPGEALDPSAIPLQAADRLLVQGPNETDEQFVRRLRGALQAWSIAGSRRAVLDQLHAYLSNLQPSVALAEREMLIVGGNADLTTWDTMTFGTPQNGIPQHTLERPASWDWDGVSKPWRSWLVLFMYQQTLTSGAAASIVSTGGSGVAGVTSGFATVTGLAGMLEARAGDYLNITGSHAPGPPATNTGSFQISSVVDDTSVIIAGPAIVAPDAANGYLDWTLGRYPFIGPSPVWGSPARVWGSFTWGVSCSPETVVSIRQIVQRWKRSAAYYPHIIVCFVPGVEFGTGLTNPDGTWGDYGINVNGTWIPSKDRAHPSTAFLDGTGRYVFCNVHNRT